MLWSRSVNRKIRLPRTPAKQIYPTLNSGAADLQCQPHTYNGRSVNLIVENSEYVKHYTYLDEDFSTIPELRKLNWLITDLELNKVEDPRLLRDPVVIDGVSLTEILQKTKMQFIWAVLSGYPQKSIEVPEDLPYADGNPNFWTGSPKPQAEGAQVEIVCWDCHPQKFIRPSRLSHTYGAIRRELDELQS